MNRGLESRGFRGGVAALILLGIVAAGIPWSVVAAGDACCAMPSCCDRDDTGCAGRMSMDRVGCCGPEQAPAVPTASQATPSVGSATEATPAIHVVALAGMTARDRLLLTDRAAAEGPPAPVPLFTVHASLLL